MLSQRFAYGFVSACRGGRERLRRRSKPFFFYNRRVREPSSSEDGEDGAKQADSVGQARLPELRQIPVERITTPRRPARRFLGDIAALAESMQDFGLQQPISVRADGDRFILTSGMRRLTAALLLRWPTIPAFVRNVSADDAYVLDLIENL